MSALLRLRAHAKVNLALRVGGVDGDGFHRLATVFQTVSLCDLLYAGRLDPGAAGIAPPASSSPEIPLRLQTEGVTLPADNTVTRAVEMLAAEVRAHGFEPAPLRMRLVKRVPAGAGLGGGSSDAVAALAACVRLWHLGDELLRESAVLQRIAAAIGSDVPFFLHGGTALGTGRGIRIEPLEPLRSTWLVIAAPDLHVATAGAYAAFDRMSAIGAAEAGEVSPGTVVPPVPDYEPRLRAAWMGNDLAAPVAALHPEVDAVRRRLQQLGAEPAQMSGSGAASFGAFGSRRAAARAAAGLRAEGLWAGAFVSITSEQHRRALFGSE